MLEEEELGQLGVLEHQTDGATEFGMRARWRLESMKAFVQQDCSARLARARLRQSGPINMEFKAGDLVMYRKAEGPRLHGSSSVLITTCCGPCIRGPQWQWQQEERGRRTCQRFCLAHTVLGDRISERTLDHFRAAGQQQGFVDISGRRRMRSEVEAGEQGRRAGAARREQSQQHLRRARSWSSNRRLQELRLEEPRAPRVKASPSNQRPNLQLGCAGTRMEHQIQEFDL